jgi:ribosome-associated protein
MDIRKLQRIIVDALEDMKAQDIQVFNTETLTSLFDRVIVASGSSNRQTRALAASVRDKVREAGGTVKNPEGAESGEWVLVDCGDAVVHLMQPAIRAYYKLEDIWGGKSVHLKVRQPPEPQPGVRAPGAAKSAPAKKTSRASAAGSSRSAAAPAKASRPAARKSAEGSRRAGAATASGSAAAPARRAATSSTTAARTAPRTAPESSVKSAASRGTARATTAATKAPAKSAAPRRATAARAKPKA